MLIQSSWGAAVLFEGFDDNFDSFIDVFLNFIGITGSVNGIPLANNPTRIGNYFF